MDLKTVVAAPFRHRGSNTLTDSEFIATLSMELDWFTPEQARRVIDLATSESLLDRSEDSLVPTFAVETISLPDDPTPDESILTERSTFEQLLDTITDAGIEKQDAVAEINRLQQELAITIEAAGVLYAHQQGIAVPGITDRIQADLTGAPPSGH